MTAVDRRELGRLLSACGAPGGVADDEAGAVFDQPWHAEVVATTLHLSRTGVFSWSEWVDCFSAEIAATPQRPGEQANDAYYRQWLAALETMLRDRRLIDGDGVQATKEDWRRSYLNTEHGKPIVFRRGLPEPELHHHHDDHHHRRAPVGPVSVCPATR